MTTTETYYKAVRPEGTDFHTGTVRWLPPVGEPLSEGGMIVTHPTTRKKTTGGAAEYLSVSTTPTDCTGFEWPCRLARVERTRAAVWTPEPACMPRKRASWQWRVVEELDPTLALGPQGAEVAAIIEQAKRMPAFAWCAEPDDDWRTARDDAWYVAWSAAREATRDAAWRAAWRAAWDAAVTTTRGAAREAATACIARDLIDPDTFAMLTEPWEALVQRYLNDAATGSNR